MISDGEVVVDLWGGWTDESRTTERSADTLVDGLRCRVAHSERRLISPRAPRAIGMFSMGGPDRIRELVIGAGFADLEIGAIEFEFGFADADDIWKRIVDVNALLGPIVNAMPPEERAELHTAVIEGFAASA